MKKIFVDLHLHPSIDQIDNVRCLLRRSADLGYNAVGLVFPPNVDNERIQVLRKECLNIGLDLITRVNLLPKNAKDLLRLLGKLRWKFEIIAVECASREVAIQAAKDWRVDLLLFAPENPRKHFFGPSEAKLASEKSAALEVNMASLIYLSGSSRINLMGALRKEVLIARKYGVPIILSSGASSPWMLRRPEDYAFLAYLIGLDLHTARQAISDNPRNIIERNRRKLSENYIYPGVYVIRRGRDC